MWSSAAQLSYIWCCFLFCFVPKRKLFMFDLICRSLWNFRSNLRLNKSQCSTMQARKITFIITMANVLEPDETLNPIFVEGGGGGSTKATLRFYCSFQTFSTDGHMGPLFTPGPKNLNIYCV